jgi:hypothetical protein
MRANAAKPVEEWFSPRPVHSGTMVIVGGAPSLNDNLIQIRERKKRGQIIAACNTAWRKLVWVKCMPHIVAVMDASPLNLDVVKDGPVGPEYWVASMCDPGVVDALEGRKVVLWHPDNNIPDTADILHPYRKTRPCVLVGGGCTVGLRMLYLGYLSGFRKFHIYGMDSSFEGDQHHAYPQPENDNDGRVTIKFNGQEYQTMWWMARQADEFRNIYWPRLTADGCSIQAHGTGLLPDTCRWLNQEAA